MKASTKRRRQQFLLRSRAESQTFLSSALASGKPAVGSGKRPLFLPKAQMLVDDKMMVCTQKQGLEKQPRDIVSLIGKDVSSVKVLSLLRNWLV